MTSDLIDKWPLIAVAVAAVTAVLGLWERASKLSNPVGAMGRWLAGRSLRRIQRQDATDDARVAGLRQEIKDLAEQMQRIREEHAEDRRKHNAEREADYVAREHYRRLLESAVTYIHLLRLDLTPTGIPLRPFPPELRETPGQSGRTP